ncbi:MAG: di-heme oxidoredictase family protein [Planctomycetota bacterium]
MRPKSEGKNVRAISWIVAAGLVLGSAACEKSSSRRPTPVETNEIGDAPAVPRHLDQAEIEAGDVPLQEVLDHGALLFRANFNELDGAGRPESTGTGAPRDRREEPENFNRISAPDANACSGCHNLPFFGGAGDNVANVFVLGQRLPFVDFDGGPGDGNAPQTLDGVANERNTVGMFGSGYVELLAREMSTRLHTIRDEAIADAQSGGTDVTRNLIAKGVDFGSITAHPDGTVDTSAVDGVDTDLIIKPFHQKGAVISLRQFSNNAYNHHHGMQAEERFGDGVDADGDGHVNELTRGDITAASLWQATLPVPGRVLPNDPNQQAAVALGEDLFNKSIADGGFDCASCHVPALKLNNPVFSEPNPFNPDGNLQVDEVTNPVRVDLTQDAQRPLLPREADGSVMVPLFSNLKRYDMGTGASIELNNEMLEQDGIPTNEWMAARLWGMANTPPFLHHGRALLISEAIDCHGGDAQASRDAWATAPLNEQQAVIEFLRTLQVLPQGSESLVVFDDTANVIGDEPAVPFHLDHDDIDAGLVAFEALFEHGQNLFAANFNTLDGAGRPESTGTGATRPRREGIQNFNRVSAPDANSCGGCHNVPRSGGGGDNVANVFVLGQALPFINFDGGAGDNFEAHTLREVANERNTLGMFGAGYIEMLAREMTSDLLAIRDQAISEAQSGGQNVTKDLVTKGVSFGRITARPNGTTIDDAIEGVDADLIIKPFHQKGAVISLREFSNNAYNHHHGMQSQERFGDGVDADVDGMVNELTPGDITAASIYQAALATPGRVLPKSQAARQAAERGEVLFGQIGCEGCHIKELRLESPIFSEPNPYNPAGNFGPGDVAQPFTFDLTTQGKLPRLKKEADGSVLVPAFTDLKRHDMGEALDTEKKIQAGIPTNQWLTRKLWGFANEPPFLHHGRATLISEAILLHGGESQASRDAFANLPPADQAAIIEFLKTLQVLPEGTSDLEIEQD